MVDIFSKITTRLLDKRNRIIGINGVDCSGKTTFTLAYSRYLASIGIKNTVVHIDDFHNPIKTRRDGENENEAYYKNAFNYDQLIKEILQPLKTKGSINKSVLCLNMDTDKYKNTKHYKVDKDAVLLIEGVLLFRTPILEYLDAKVFIHADFDEVLRRVALRDVPKYGEGILEKYNHKYIPIQQRYLREFKPQYNCDAYIDNNNYKNPHLYRFLPPSRDGKRLKDMGYKLTGWE